VTKDLRPEFKPLYHRKKKERKIEPGMMAHIHNPSHSGGRNKKIMSSRPTQAKLAR
jgi:hypothetical protein